MDLGFLIDTMRNYFICLSTYYINMKMLNILGYNYKKKVILLFLMLVVTFISNSIKQSFSLVYSIIALIMLISLIFCKFSRKEYTYAYSILITIISLSVSYILFTLAILLSYIIHELVKVQNEILNFSIILIIFCILVFNVFKIKRIKNGLNFLKEKLKNEYFNILILNISMMILLLIVILSNYNHIIAKNFGISLIIFSIIMIITIQKSLQLYYKQKMLVKDLEETKKELEDKKAEVKELEKENLNFSKISHTIAHRQKSLEHKLEELNTNSEISNELGARIENVTKDLKKETAVELSKTGIEVIDDMLSYMQSECIKNKIDFQLQINGNIYTMTNHYIGKDELEILLADHIKNAIIAIGYADSVNKSILVRLGKIDGNYGLYIYDSGIEFEIDTFINLGIKPSTTHKDNGGTGMGFMNTFDTLRKYKASLEIEEIGKPCKDNITKVLKVEFDNKEEFKIKSYRKDEIKKKDKENKLNLI